MTRMFSTLKMILCAAALMTGGLLIAGAGTAAAQASTTIAKAGKAQAVIVVDPTVMEVDQKVARNPTLAYKAELDRRRLRESIDDLALYLGKLSGGTFQVVTTDPKAGDTQDMPVHIYVGKPAIAIFGNAKHASYDQGLRVVVKGNKIGLIGESHLATSYAIYELLDQLGCRWYMPSDMGEYLPSTPTITLQNSDKNTAPFTDYRGIWYCDAAYRRRNRMGGLKLSAGHALEGYVSKEAREEHPEWVATVDGKPSKRRLKWSAKGLPEYIASAIIERQKANPQETYSLSPGDGRGYDNSPEDLALDAGDFDPSTGQVSITDRLVWFVNQIARDVNKVYPDLQFGMLAYSVYFRPPVRETLDSHITPQLAPITYRRTHPTDDMKVPGNEALMATIKGWNKRSSGLSYYYYGWNLAEPSAPSPFLTKWGHDVPLAMANGCKFWQPETFSNFETMMHALYMSLRLAWDPNQKPQDIFDEINRNFYQHAAKEMATYWEFIDHCWVDTPEYSGAGFGYNRIFTPERMAKARELMNAALIACQSPIELARVKMADASLAQFERFMQIREDFAAGRWAYLSEDADSWCYTETELARKYAAQYAFTGTRGRSRSGSWGRSYYQIFYKKTYDDANRIQKEGVVLTNPPLNEWKYQADKDAKGETLGYEKVDFDDSSWKTTDVNMQTWSSLGYHDYFGTMWYRATVKPLALRKGKKVYLWLGSADGPVKVYVNGKHVPYVDTKGESKDFYRGFCKPVSFDITDLVKLGQPIHVSLETQRTSLNELGIGGLLGPLAIYRER